MLVSYYVYDPISGDYDNETITVNAEDEADAIESVQEDIRTKALSDGYNTDYSEGVPNTTFEVAIFDEENNLVTGYADFEVIED